MTPVGSFSVPGQKMDMRSYPQNLWGGIGSPVPGWSLSLTAIIPLLAFTGSLEFFLDFPSAVICSGLQGLYISSVMSPGV